MPRVKFNQAKVDMLVEKIMDELDIDELRVAGKELGALVMKRTSIGDIAEIVGKVGELFGGLHKSLELLADDISEGADMTAEANKAMAKVLDDVVEFEGWTGRLLEMIDGPIFEYIIKEAFEFGDDHLVGAADVPA